MKTVRERPRVAVAIVAGLAWLVVMLLMVAGGGAKTDPTAQQRLKTVATGIERNLALG